MSKDFHRRAVAESERYGDDPWVLLRELGQNSRDAFASQIEVLTRVENDSFFLIFADDGKGMTLAHARAYLFRLYASSKGDDGNSAGRFGVGFWSILRFSPSCIEVHSRCKTEAWGVRLAGDLSSWKSLDCKRSTLGTSVVLVKNLNNKDAESIRNEIHSGLVKYLAHLRTVGLRSKVLPVRFDGHRIERPFTLKSPGKLRFRDGPIEGVVGFGPRPRYKLYARGLPVVEGAFLDELEGKKARKGYKAEREGVAPVFILNGNNLDVVLSRQSVVQNRALKELVRVARRRFDELVSRTIDGSVQPSLIGKANTFLEEFVRMIGRGPIWLRSSAIMMGLVLIGGLMGLGFASIRHHEKPDQQTTPQANKQPDESSYGDEEGVPAYLYDSKQHAALTAAHRPNALVGMRTSTVVSPQSVVDWAFSYSPGKSLLFRQYLLDQFDPSIGWQASGDGKGWRRPKGARTGNQVEIRLLFENPKGYYVIPVPTGYQPAAQAYYGDQKVQIEVNALGLARVNLPRSAKNQLRYFAYPSRQVESGLVERMRSMPAIRLPRAMRKLLKERNKSTSWRINAAIDWLHARMRYDQSATTAARYAHEVGQANDWVERVLHIGAGDCDVINGLLVLMLRYQNIPTRLVAGIAGQSGRGLSGWHAWVEVIERGKLRTLDATVGSQRLQPSTHAGATVAADPGGLLRGQLSTGSSNAFHSNAGETPIGQDTRSAISRINSKAVTFGATLLSTAFVFALLLIFLSMRQSGRLAVTKDSTNRLELLAGMAADALRRPKAWKGVPGIWHRKFLPCLGNRHISLAQLTRLSRSEKVFVGRTNTDLVEKALRSKAVVLAANDPYFGSLYSRTANLRDLDDLARNKPIKSTDRRTRKLLASINRLLRQSGVKVPCHSVVAENGKKLCWDVDLAPIRTSNADAWPRCFVAINPDNQWWRSLLALHQETPKTAVAIAIDHLCADSQILSCKASVLRRLAAREAMLEFTDERNG